MKEYRASRIEYDDMYNFDDINDDFYDFELIKPSKTTYDVHKRPKASKGGRTEAKLSHMADRRTSPKPNRHHIDIDAACAALLNNHDKCTLEKNPLVLAYERRNQINKHQSLLPRNVTAQFGQQQLEDSRQYGDIHSHLPRIHKRTTLEHDSQLQDDLIWSSKRQDVYPRSDLKSHFEACLFDEAKTRDFSTPVPPTTAKARDCFTPAPPTTAKARDCFTPAPPATAKPRDCFTPAPPTTAKPRDCFTPAPPPTVKARDCFTPAPPTTAKPRDCFTPAPPTTAKARDCFTPAPPTTAKPRDYFTPAPPSTAKARDCFTPAPPTTAKPRDYFTPTPPTTAKPRDCFTPAPPTTAKARDCFTPAPPTTAKPRDCFTPAPPTTAKVRESFTTTPSTVTIPCGNYIPSPPKTTKPPDRSDDLVSFRRRKLYRSNQLEQDVSVHNPSVNYHKPCTPVFTETDYEKELQLAKEMYEEFDIYHQALDEIKKSLEEHNGSYEHVMSEGSSCQTLGTAGYPMTCNTAVTASSFKPNAPRRPWDATNARRGVGYRSKANKEKKESQQNDDRVIPEKIRKEMKKYFT